MSHLPPDDEVRQRVETVRRREAAGDLQLLGEPGGDLVALAEPQPGWPALFDSIRQLLSEALGATARRIDHVGSTAVPGLAAKPVIDVQVSVADVDAEEAYRPQIEALGWPLRGREPALGHRFFRDPAGRPRRVHVHVCQEGGDWERKHLLFRDYLRAHPLRAAEYAALKRAAAAQYAGDRLAYTEAKGPFIDETLALAEQWARVTDWRA